MASSVCGAAPSGSRFPRADAARRTVVDLLRAGADALLTVLLAPCCAACGQLLERPSEGPVCDRCWASIRPLTAPLCDRCGDPLAAWRVESVASRRCPRCRRGATDLDRARAAGAYEGALRAVVHAFKYDGRRSLAVPLASLMKIRGAEMLSGAACVVPVPLHPSRQRQRGFNQAGDLARQLGLPVRPVLRRRRATPAQAGLPASRRHRNVRNAFGLARLRSTGLAGSIVVLVDDVSTTGATLSACAKVLKAEAGVTEVRALTAARVVMPPLRAHPRPPAPAGVPH